MVFSLCNALFTLAFLLSAGVQYNDPDGLLWGVTYLCAAAMCVSQFAGPRLPWLPGVLLVASLAWAGLLLPEVVGQVQWRDLVSSMHMRTAAVERGRETGGLLLVAFWSGILLIRQHRRQR
ncbi:transmembrane 220 family protein [Parahaliea mediterranea]|uniref:Transmembrane 220 family protein n=1 Tax=Parahaliea mediterranea TaxID=651086 RepID=A0A939ILV8_9GAMM|nr:transmembrane 220 family protein [Parahaliea mediterranea]MBN7796367.1 transmembrane 220 family protein [Parahaliea mediterranea]